MGEVQLGGVIGRCARTLIYGGTWRNQAVAVTVRIQSPWRQLGWLQRCAYVHHPAMPGTPLALLTPAVPCCAVLAQATDHALPDGLAAVRLLHAVRHVMCSPRLEHPSLARVHFCAVEWDTSSGWGEGQCCEGSLHGGSDGVWARHCQGASSRGRQLLVWTVSERSDLGSLDAALRLARLQRQPPRLPAILHTAHVSGLVAAVRQLACAAYCSWEARGLLDAVLSRAACPAPCLPQEVASGLHHLHTHHLAHGQLSSASVLLCSAPDDARGFAAKVWGSSGWRGYLLLVSSSASQGAPCRSRSGPIGDTVIVTGHCMHDTLCLYLSLPLTPSRAAGPADQQHQLPGLPGGAAQLRGHTPHGHACHHRPRGGPGWGGPLPRLRCLQPGGAAVGGESMGGPAAAGPNSGLALPCSAHRSATATRSHLAFDGSHTLLLPAATSLPSGLSRHTQWAASTCTHRSSHPAPTRCADVCRPACLGAAAGAGDARPRAAAPRPALAGRVPAGLPGATLISILQPAEQLVGWVGLQDGMDVKCSHAIGHGGVTRRFCQMCEAAFPPRWHSRRLLQELVSACTHPQAAARPAFPAILASLQAMLAQA